MSDLINREDALDALTGVIPMDMSIQEYVKRTIKRIRGIPAVQTEQKLQNSATDEQCPENCTDGGE